MSSYLHRTVGGPATISAASHVSSSHLHTQRPDASRVRHTHPSAHLTWYLTLPIHPSPCPSYVPCASQIASLHLDLHSRLRPPSPLTPAILLLSLSCVLHLSPHGSSMAADSRCAAGDAASGKKEGTRADAREMLLPCHGLQWHTSIATDVAVAEGS